MGNPVDAGTKQDFFISHQDADRAWAEWLASELHAAGYAVFLPSTGLSPGVNFVRVTSQAREKASTVMVLISPDYLAMLYTQPEWLGELTRLSTKGSSGLMPVRIRPSLLKGPLGDLRYIDLAGRSEQDARETLLAEAHSRARELPPAGARQSKGTPLTGSSPPFPAALPPVWNVPHDRRPDFTGREQELAAVRKGLAYSETGVPPTVVLSGLAGMGKTTLAVEYVYRYAIHYQAIWWLPAGDERQLAESYVQLGGALGLCERADLGGATATAVKEWLSGNRDWLLVFDEAVGSEVLSEYLPVSWSGHVLITSRTSAWPQARSIVGLGPLDRRKAAQLLQKQTGETDEGASTRVAKLLGGVPLALDEAAEAVAEGGTSLSDLALRLEAEGPAQEPPVSTAVTHIISTWSGDLVRTMRQITGTWEILNLLAFLGPTDIPPELLVVGAEYLPGRLRQEVEEHDRYVVILGKLARQGLVDSTPGAVSVNPLVQSAARKLMSEESRELWLTAALRILNTAFPHDATDAATWETSERLLPHALTAATHAEETGVAPDSAVRVLNQIGLYQLARGRNGDALAALDRARSIATRDGNVPQEVVAKLLNNAGAVLEEEGRHEEAKRRYEQARDINLVFFGEGHVEVGTSINNLAGLAYIEGDLAEAEALYRDALKIDEEVGDRPERATTLNNLGNVYYSKGDFEGAVRFYEDALRIDEEFYGREHPATAVDLSNLGRAYFRLERFARAKQCFKEAAAIDTLAYGTDHPALAVDLGNLGEVHLMEGAAKAALEHYRQALALERAEYGADDPVLAPRLFGLARALDSLGDFEKAELYYERALGLLKETSGQESLAEDVWDRLAQLRQRQGSQPV